MQADRQTPVPAAVAGDIVALAGLKGSRAGTTLSSREHPVELEAFRPTEPVVSVAVEPRARADAQRLPGLLVALTDEDPSLSVRLDPETGQTLLSGLGELHLEVAIEKVRRASGVSMVVGRPQVAYREAVVKGVTGVHYRHAKQDGGRGQFAEVVLDVTPQPAGFSFASAVTGGHVPAEFIRAVEAGCREALAEGPHPIVGLRVTLIDGATHVKDSSELAFRVAGRLGLRAALAACELVILEPVAEVSVDTPAETVGAVLGDLAARRGRVIGTSERQVTAIVPLAAMFGYATDLRNRSHGRGSFTSRPAGYRPAA